MPDTQVRRIFHKTGAEFRSIAKVPKGASTSKNFHSDALFHIVA